MCESETPICETDTIVRLRGLSRSFHVGPEVVHALDHVDLDIQRARSLAVVGVSGSGKSTLLQLLGALDTPDSGTISVDGQDLVGLTPRDRTQYRRTQVGFVFQSFQLLPALTALENVELALTFQGVFGRARSSEARGALARVGLEQRLSHRPGQLSGGEQQRVAIARAIVHHPAMLLADEPTGNLDHQNAARVLDLLGSLQRDDGTTVVLVTHDESSAERIADRLVRLRDGRVESESP